MKRLLGTPPGEYNLPKLRVEAAAAWPKLEGLNEVNDGVPRIGLYFEDADAPTQTAINTLMAAHTPTPLPPTAEQTQLAVDKNIVQTFMAAASGTATPVQRDDVTKAVVRYLWRSGTDA